jgi:hypothetical protein
MTITLNTAFRIAQDKTSSNLENETIVLDYSNGIYFELNQLGGYIWNLLQSYSSITFNELLNKIIEEFEISKEMCQTDLEAFLQNLIHDKLIEKAN